jgi:concanavalin A-like lectin/glucanase superfamily protein
MMHTMIRVLVISLGFVASVVNAQTYHPDIREFNFGDDLVFAGHSSFDLYEQGTVEFWVAAGWENDPGYDPVLIYHAGSTRLLFALSMLGDRGGLSLQTDSQIDELFVSFADDQLHHIALVNLGDSVGLMVDGQVIGAFQVSLVKGDSTEFRFGSAPGPSAEFVGALGGFRIWDITVDQESLIVYALDDPLNSVQPHPDLESLKAYSNLTVDTIEFTEAADSEPTDLSKNQ